MSDASKVGSLPIDLAPERWLSSDISLVIAAIGEVIRRGGGEAAESSKGAAVQQEVQEYTGVHLAEEMFDLMRRRLPRLADDDPMRETYQAWLPCLGSALGRPVLLPVEALPRSA